jgi:putative restriction endonuclease
LFDRGYVTVTPEHRIEVSKGLKADFDNGKDYLTSHGKAIRVPENLKNRPSALFLRWRNQERFLG